MVAPNETKINGINEQVYFAYVLIDKIWRNFKIYNRRLQELFDVIKSFYLLPADGVCT